MESNKNNQLIEILKRKGILFERGDKDLFKSYDYYQVINGYKSLFISTVESIRDIFLNITSNKEIERYKKDFNINRNLNNNDLFREICKKICKKYGLYYSSKISINNLIIEIEKIDYVHHIYRNNTRYSDFVRMYKFEHELRLMLLRYSLIIEENMKNIFVSVLNDFEVSANFLTDINSYNIEDVNNNNALETLKLIIDKHGNKHSKPIRRKREQNLTIPYWILVNELAMNQTYRAIDNLKPNYSRTIFQECLNHFTNLNLNYADKNKNYEKRKVEKDLINKFKIILSYIGEFRNILAHNQPIYTYNIENCNMSVFPELYYEKPKTRSSNDKVLNNGEQHKMNALLMYDIQKFFGVDQYNVRNKGININLSWIIYIIYKMIKHIDNNTNFFKELKMIFSKYNIMISEYTYEVSNINQLIELKKQISMFSDLELDVQNIINKIENKQAYKRNLKAVEKEIINNKKSFNRLSKNISINKIGSKYNTFLFNDSFNKFTGIDASYFDKIQ